MKQHAYLFTDGSSSKPGDIGAWAAVAVCGDQRKLLYGVDFPTTISRCELRPIIEGLRHIRDHWCVGTGFRVCVVSDSEYTIKTLSGVYDRHKNMDLWAGIDEVCKGMAVTFMWRERNSLPYMELCDGVCGALRRRQIDHMKTVAPDPRAPETVLPVWDVFKAMEGAHEETVLRDQPGAGAEHGSHSPQ